MGGLLEDLDKQAEKAHQEMKQRMEEEKIKEEEAKKKATLEKEKHDLN